MKTLRLLLKHEMISLEPNSYNTDSSSATVILRGTVTQNLIGLDRDMNFVPELAESWAVEDDHRVFRFRLRRGVRFHNGTLLDPAKIVWNYRRLFDTQANSLLGRDYEGLVSVDQTGPDEVTFRFDRPNVPFLYNIAWRTHIVDDVLTQPVGTGPFRVAEWVRGSHLVLERFADYWERGLPKADRLEITWAPDSEDCLRRVRAGEADIVESVPAKAAAALEAENILRCIGVASPRKTVVAFNCKAAPFNDPRMRQAVAHAFDRAGLIEALLGAHGHLVESVLPESEPWTIPLKGLPHDPVAAARLVREAGYENGVDVKAFMTNVAPVPKAASMIADALRPIGIRLHLQGFDDPPWWPYVYLQGDWQIAFQGASARPHIHTLFSRDLVSDGPFNPGGFSNARLDEVVSLARQTSDLARQKELYAEAQRIVFDQTAILPLYAADVFAGHKPSLTGFKPHPLGYLDLRYVE
jgi:ABC-type transport system substrate-binding protein